MNQQEELWIVIRAKELALEVFDRVRRGLQSLVPPEAVKNLKDLQGGVLQLTSQMGPTGQLIGSIASKLIGISAGFLDSGKSSREFLQSLDTGGIIAFGSALSGAVIGAGRLASMIGDTLTAAAREWFKAASEGERATLNLALTMGDFDVAGGKAGARATALTESIKQLSATYGVADTAIAEGSLRLVQQQDDLGLTDAQMKKLIETGTALAATYQRDVGSAIFALTYGLQGVGRPLRSFGLQLRDAEVATRQLGDTTGKTFALLNTQEKAQLRLNELLSKLGDVAGRAGTVMGTTVAGGMARAAVAAHEFEQRLGRGVSVVYEFTTQGLLRFYAALNQLPDRLVETAGGITAVTGGLAKGAGSILDFTGKLGLVVTAIAAINSILPGTGRLILATIAHFGVWGGVLTGIAVGLGLIAKGLDVLDDKMHEGATVTNTMAAASKMYRDKQAELVAMQERLANLEKGREGMSADRQRSQDKVIAQTRERIALLQQEVDVFGKAAAAVTFVGPPEPAVDAAAAAVAHEEVKKRILALDKQGLELTLNQAKAEMDIGTIRKVGEALLRQEYEDIENLRRKQQAGLTLTAEDQEAIAKADVNMALQRKKLENDILDVEMKRIEIGVGPEKARAEAAVNAAQTQLAATQMAVTAGKAGAEQLMAAQQRLSGAQVAVAQANLKMANQQLAVQQEAFRQGNISATQLEVYKTKVQTAAAALANMGAEGQLAMQKTAIAAREAELALLEAFQGAAAQVQQAQLAIEQGELSWMENLHERGLATTDEVIAKAEEVERRMRQIRQTAFDTALVNLRQAIGPVADQFDLVNISVQDLAANLVAMNAAVPGAFDERKIIGMKAALDAANVSLREQLHIVDQTRQRYESTIKLTDFLKQGADQVWDALIAGTRKTTFMEAAKGLATSFGKQVFDKIIADKTQNFDKQWNVNFLRDLPGSAKSGANAITDIFKGALSLVGIKFNDTAKEGAKALATLPTNAEKTAQQSSEAFHAIPDSAKDAYGACVTEAEQGAAGMNAAADQAGSGWFSFFKELLSLGGSVFSQLMQMAGGFLNLLGLGGTAGGVFGMLGGLLGGGGGGSGGTQQGSALGSALGWVSDVFGIGTLAKDAAEFTGIDLKPVTSFFQGLGPFLQIAGAAVGTIGGGAIALNSRAPWWSRLLGGATAINQAGTLIGAASRMIGTGIVPLAQGGFAIMRGGQVVQILGEGFVGPLQEGTNTLGTVLSGFGGIRGIGSSLWGGVKGAGAAIGGYLGLGGSIGGAAAGLGPVAAGAGPTTGGLLSLEQVVANAMSPAVTEGITAAAPSIGESIGTIVGQALGPILGKVLPIVGGIYTAVTVLTKLSKDPFERGHLLDFFLPEGVGSSINAAVEAKSSEAKTREAERAAIHLLFGPIVAALFDKLFPPIIEWRRVMIQSFSESVSQALGGRPTERAKGGLPPQLRGTEVVGETSLLAGAALGRYGVHALARIDLFKDFRQIIAGALKDDDLETARKDVHMLVRKFFGNLYSLFSDWNVFVKSAREQGVYKTERGKTARDVQDLGALFSVGGVDVGEIFAKYVTEQGHIRMDPAKAETRQTVLKAWAEGATVSAREARNLGDIYLVTVAKLAKKLPDSVDLFGIAAAIAADGLKRKFNDIGQQLHIGGIEMVKRLQQATKLAVTLAEKGLPQLTPEESAKFGEATADRHRQYRRTATAAVVARQEIVQFGQQQLATAGGTEAAYAAKQATDRINTITKDLATQAETIGKVHGKKLKEARDQLDQLAKSAVEAVKSWGDAVLGLLQKIRDLDKAIVDSYLTLGDESASLRRTTDAHTRYAKALTDQAAAIDAATTATGKADAIARYMDLLRRQAQAEIADLQRGYDEREKARQKRLEEIGPAAGQAEGLRGMLDQIAHAGERPRETVARAQQDFAKALGQFWSTTGEERAKGAAKAQQAASELLQVAGSIFGTGSTRYRQLSQQIIAGLTPMTQAAEAAAEEQTRILKAQKEDQEKVQKAIDKVNLALADQLDLWQGPLLTALEAQRGELMQQLEQILTPEMLGVPAGPEYDKTIKRLLADPQAAALLVAQLQLKQLQEINKTLSDMAGIGEGAAGGGNVKIDRKTGLALGIGAIGQADFGSRVGIAAGEMANADRTRRFLGEWNPDWDAAGPGKPAVHKAMEWYAFNESQSFFGVSNWGGQLKEVPVTKEQAGRWQDLARKFHEFGLEKGGVVMRETLIQIGERNKREAVIPLQEPAALRMVGQAIVAQFPAGAAAGKTEVNVELKPTIVIQPRPGTSAAEARLYGREAADEFEAKVIESATSGRLSKIFASPLRK